MEEHFRIGVFANTHGLRGEIKVYPTTDDVMRFKKLKRVWMDTKRELLPLEVQGVKFFKNMPILKFKGIDSIDDIEKYKGSDLLVTREEAVPLEEGEFYIADIIGMPVWEEDGTPVGVLTEVLKTGANDVYVVRTPWKKELLLPAIPECILDIDFKEGRMKIHMMEGLGDL